MVCHFYTAHPFCGWLCSYPLTPTAGQSPILAALNGIAYPSGFIDDPSLTVSYSTSLTCSQSTTVLKASSRFRWMSWLVQNTGLEPVMSNPTSIRLRATVADVRSNPQPRMSATSINSAYHLSKTTSSTGKRTPLDYFDRRSYNSISHRHFSLWLTNAQLSSTLIATLHFQ